MAGTQRQSDPAGPSGAAGGPVDPLASLLLAAALVIGLLRFFRLGEWSLWIDEVYTWADAHADAGRNYNGLGYGIVQATVLALGGKPTEFALRLAPAIAGWLSIGVTAWALRPIGGARRASFAALVVAASPWALYWSQNARFYTFVTLTTLVGAGVLVRGLAQGRLGMAAVGVAFMVGAAAFQLQALLVVLVVASGIALVAPRLGDGAELGDGTGSDERAEALRRATRRAGWLGLGAALIASPWAWGVFGEYRAQKSGSVGAAVHGLLTLGVAISPALGAAFLLGAWVALKERAGVFATWVGAAGPVAVVVLGLLARTSAQYAFAFLPWIALVAAWPVGRGPQCKAPLTRGPLTLGYAFLVAAPLVAGSLLQLGPGHGDRPRWREAIAHVEEHRAPGDLIVAMPAPVAEFYLSQGGTDVRLPEHVKKLDVSVPRAYERYAAEGRPMWLIVRTESLKDFPREERARLEAFLQGECRRAAEFEVDVLARNLDVEVWRRE